MTATDELRRLLDERGVEHYDGTEGTYWGGSVLARNGLNSVYRFSARGVVGGLDVHLLCVTPEQAIEATLERGTCRITDNGPWGYPYVCSECGASFDPDVNGGGFNYCPNCGRKVRA